jgi:site-specific DNA-cytosine methylase
LIRLGVQSFCYAGGPPCPDFSGIADSACGREGQEGHKFVVFSEFVKRWEKLLRPRDFLLLVENVVMQNPADTQYFTDALQAQPILVDPADFTIISRPRLFWTRVRWCVVRLGLVWRRGRRGCLRGRRGAWRTLTFTLRGRRGTW